MKKLSKIAQVTFFAAAFAVLFSGTADAYIEKEVNHIGKYGGIGMKVEKRHHI